MREYLAAEITFTSEPVAEPILREKQTGWLAMQCCATKSPPKFPANREFYREFRLFGA
jgi:hypothetical protein